MSIFGRITRMLRSLFGAVPESAHGWSDRAQRARLVDERSRWFVER